MSTSFDPAVAPTSRSWEPLAEQALLEACQFGDIAALQRLLSEGAQADAIDAQGFRLLHVAATYGHVAVIDALLTAGASIDARSVTPGCYDGIRPLHAAVSNRHSEAVDCLISRGANLEATDDAGFASLHLAILLGARGIVKSLLRAGANPHREVADASPLQLARRYGDPVLVGLLRQCTHVGWLPPARTTVG
ncbi:MAG: ankyrin repeat domain-containing protein [Myxococcota bacterium]